MPSPYADTARAYLDGGWSPIPLPYKEKFPPPVGVTGYSGAFVTEEMVEAYAKGGPRNVGMRLPETVIGIDVDDYGDKGGGAALADAESRLGLLPPTWRSTSRPADLTSGIRFYRVPAGRQWADTVGPGVEIVHHGHRYAVAAPSLHPEGREYLWFDEDGFPTDALPAVDDLPLLPDAWVAALDRGDLSERIAKVDLKESEAGHWLQTLPGGDPCPAVIRVLDTAEAHFAFGATRHDTARNLALRMIRLGEQGHAGASVGLDTLEALFANAVGGERPIDREWARILSGGAALILAAPTPAEDKGCCGSHADLSDVFEETDRLRHIRDAAYAAGRSPAAMLGTVLGRVLAAVPPSHVLPGAEDGAIGSRASLNLGIVLMGPSGKGKSDLSKLSEGVLGVDQSDIQRTPSSGEGMIQSYLRYTNRTNEVAAHYRLFNVDEIGQLAAQKERGGATIGAILRSMLMGNQTGTENAEASRRRNLPANCYRMVLFAGVQPRLSDVLLNPDETAAGLPQRFVWLRVQDPNIPPPGDRPKWPGSLDWNPTFKPDEVVIVDYPDAIKEMVVRQDYENVTGQNDSDGSDSHLTLTRLKVAAALALLHLSSDEEGAVPDVVITDQWWRIAGRIIDESVRVQYECRRLIGNVNQEKHNSVAIAKDRAEDAAEADKVQRTAKAILRKVQEADGEWVTWRAVRPAHRLREYADDAIELLVATGQVEVEDYVNEKKVESRRLRFVR
ncbi:MAG TPA: bifunctional DNA primase/polymerase [Nocardioidaceae bacterium]|nr:bifunctional DNA primase/polymerase [Nocardioidaceae bacterium]